MYLNIENAIWKIFEEFQIWTSKSIFDNCEALKDADKFKQAYIKMCVACSKFCAALDRILPGNPNLDLNLVCITPID